MDKIGFYDFSKTGKSREGRAYTVANGAEEWEEMAPQGMIRHSEFSKMVT